MTRHTTTGNAKPWEVAKGYAHQSRYSSRWERPAGEPSLFYGALIVLGGLGGIALFIETIRILMGAM